MLFTRASSIVGSMFVNLCLCRLFWKKVLTCRNVIPTSSPSRLRPRVLQEGLVESIPLTLCSPRLLASRQGFLHLPLCEGGRAVRHETLVYDGFGRRAHVGSLLQPPPHDPELRSRETQCLARLTPPRSRGGDWPDLPPALPA